MPKTQTIKEKTGKLYSTKNKRLCAPKGTVRTESRGTGGRHPSWHLPPLPVRTLAVPTPRLLFSPLFLLFGSGPFCVLSPLPSFLFVPTSVSPLFYSRQCNLYFTNGNHFHFPSFRLLKITREWVWGFRSQVPQSLLCCRSPTSALTQGLPTGTHTK